MTPTWSTVGWTFVITAIVFGGLGFATGFAEGAARKSRELRQWLGRS